MNEIKPGPMALSSVKTEDLITELNYRARGENFNPNIWITNRNPKPHTFHLVLVDEFVPDMGLENDRIVVVSYLLYRDDEHGWDLGSWNEKRNPERQDKVIAWMPMPTVPEEYRNSKIDYTE